MKQLKGSLLIIISSLAYSLYGPISRSIENYDLFFQTFARSLIVCILLIFIGLFFKKLSRIDKKDIKWFVVLSIFACFSISPIVYSYKFLTLGTSSFLFYGSFIIFAFIFGKLFFKEKVTKDKIAALVIATIGLLTVFTVNFDILLVVPILAAVINGVGVSGDVFTKKLSGKYSLVQVTLITYIAIAISHLAISIMIQENLDLTIVTAHSVALGSFALISIVGSSALLLGYKYIDVSVGSIIGLSEIIFSALVGIIFFSENISASTWIGGGLILIASALPSIMNLIRPRFFIRKN